MVFDVQVVRAMKRAEGRGLRTKADELWSLVIRKRAGGRCELAVKDSIRCGPWRTDKNGNLKLIVQGAHLITRAASSIRHDLRNGRSLCKAHHKFYAERQHLWEEVCKRVWLKDYEYCQMAKWRNVNHGMYPVIIADFEAKLKELG